MIKIKFHFKFSVLFNYCKVIEVKAAKRHGSENFVSSLKKTLKNHYGDEVVALGGVFLVEKGSSVHSHIMVTIVHLQTSSQQILL